MTHFTNNTQFNNQTEKGMIIGFSHEGKRFGLHVWVDNSEPDNVLLRTTLDGNPDSLILVTVELSDFTSPDVSYSEDKTYCYVTFNNNSLHIKLDDEGVVLDVWDSQNDEHGSIDTSYFFYTDLEDEGA